MSVSLVAQSLVQHPTIDRWLSFDTAGVVAARTGKVELGQGILTALVQIVAEELGVRPDQISLTSGDTRRDPDEAVTGGSFSIEHGGRALALAASAAREVFLAEVRRRQGGDGEVTIAVSNGEFKIDGRSSGLTYWNLAAAVDLSVVIADFARPKAPETYTLVGRELPRVDLRAKFGGGAFIHDLVLPGMLHGRLVRRSRIDTTLQEFDQKAVEALPGVRKVVRQGSFIGVVTAREEQAVAAARKAARLTHWVPQPSFPLEPERIIATTNAVPSRAHETGTPPVSTSKRYHATFTKPFLAHASIGPCCALAVWQNGEVHVWSHTQGVFPLRAALARALEISPEAVHVTHVPGAGCYGHNGADDVGLDAALLARSVPGTPVRVVWSCEDELVHSPLGTAMAITITADVDDTGRIVGWATTVRTGTHACRPGWGTSINLLAADEIANIEQKPNNDPPGGGERNALPLYDIPYVVVDKQVVDLSLRLSSLRTLGGYANVYALECMIDEIAADLGRDPAAFRLAHLSDIRGRGVIERVIAMSPWTAQRKEGSGLGLGFARYKNKSAYCAVVAEVVVDEEVRVTHAWAAVDAGLTINPNGVRNQIEGGIVQSMSWTLIERVQFDEAGIASRSWDTYPITTFANIPDIEVDIIQQLDQPSVGVGEASQGPMAAAIGNAVRQALGVRIRDLPITRERVIAALA